MGQRIGEFLEAAIVAALFGDLVKPPLGFFDLLTRRGVDRRVIGDVDDILADIDQVPAQRQIVDRAAIVFRIDDGRGFGGGRARYCGTVTPPKS